MLIHFRFTIFFVWLTSIRLTVHELTLNLIQVSVIET